MASIDLHDVSVGFPVFSSHTRSLRGVLANRLGGDLATGQNTVLVKALDGVSVSFRDGDRVALIGHNGSGKTTLLRVLAGVYPPAGGDISIAGNVSAFTDVTLGMDMEANGWDNIVFRSVFLGMDFEAARALMPKVAEFTQLGHYLDMPVRTYSTGMLLRLAFAIATSIDPDILLMDEIISAGDPAFIEQAMARIRGLLERTKITIIASQLPTILELFCNKALWLEHGRVLAMGEAGPILAKYLASQKAGI